MPTACSLCHLAIAATTADPVVACSAGSYHYACFQRMHREKALRESSRREAIRAGRSERMRARMAAKKTS